MSYKFTSRLTLSTAFSVFLLIITVLFGTAICVVVFFKVDSLVRENRQEFIHQEMQGISRELVSYLSLRNNVLRDYAKFPVITQTVMQPAANRGNIEDFLNELTLLSEHVPFTLLDFSGKVIYRTQGASDTELNTNLMARIEKDSVASTSVYYEVIKEKEGNGYFIKLISPVFYQNIVEGFLLVDIKIDHLVKTLALAQHSKQHRIQLNKDGTVIFDIGSKDKQTNEGIFVDSLGIELAFNTDEKTLKIARLALLIELMLWLFVVWVIIVIVSNKLGFVFLIEPLVRLQNFANELADGKEVNMDLSANKFYEIRELESHFKTMVDKVARREHSLKHAKDSLQELNDRLVENQQQLLHSEKLASVGHLAAGVAHEINNPTGFVMGNLDVLREYIEDIEKLLSEYHVLEGLISINAEENIKQKISSIESLKSDIGLEYILSDTKQLIKDSLDGTSRIKNIVMDLKNFSRIDSLEKSPVDINEEVIETALRLVWSELKYKCTLNKNLSELPTYPCNSGELCQVILNLLVNASDAINENGEISISSELMDSYIRIQVSDNGSGIENKDLIKLFDPFFTTKEVGKGTGLGLSTSNRIIEKHGGMLTVSSKVGQGTVFTILLPLD